MTANEILADWIRANGTMVIDAINKTCVLDTVALSAGIFTEMAKHGYVLSRVELGEGCIAAWFDNPEW